MSLLLLVLALALAGAGVGVGVGGGVGFGVGVGCASPAQGEKAPLEAEAGAAPARFVACTSGDPARQRNGSRCLCCHADEFGVAGSVDPSGSAVARVVVTDSQGDRREMAPNLFGNFFAHYALVPPLRAVAYSPDGRASEMRAEAPSADCNACHAKGGPALPLGGAAK